MIRVRTVVLSYTLMFVIFGTALPAAAADERPGLKLTLARSLQTAPDILVGLITGPGLFYGLMLMGFMIIANFGLVIEPYDTAPSGFDIVQLLVGLPVTALNLFGTILTVIVLCGAYAKVAPNPILEVMTGAIGPNRA